MERPRGEVFVPDLFGDGETGFGQSRRVLMMTLQPHHIAEAGQGATP
jgi:hypothetical protein